MNELCLPAFDMVERKITISPYERTNERQSTRADTNFLWTHTQQSPKDVCLFLFQQYLLGVVFYFELKN